MSHNIFLYNIFESVKTLDAKQMSNAVSKIIRLNTILNRYINYRHYRQNNRQPKTQHKTQYKTQYKTQFGGINESLIDISNSTTQYDSIMENLGLIDSNLGDKIVELQKYIDIFLTNASQFEILVKDRLALDSLIKLRASVKNLNFTLNQFK